MKKGSMHIEVIISFTLFLAFVVFLMFYIKPVKQSTLSDSVAVPLIDAFEKTTLTNVTTGFLKTNTTATCFWLTLPVKGNSSVSSIDGSLVNSAMASNNLFIDSSSGNYAILLSDDIISQNIPSGCEKVNDSDYSLGNFDTTQMVSEEKLLELKSSYDANYEKLKEDFNIPATINFKITSDIRGVNMEKPIPAESESFSKSNSYQVIYLNGSISNHQFNFVIW